MASELLTAWLGFGLCSVALVVRMTLPQPARLVRMRSRMR
jgi:hypothetical protein